MKYLFSLLVISSLVGGCSKVPLTPTIPIFPWTTVSCKYIVADVGIIDGSIPGALINYYNPQLNKVETAYVPEWHSWESEPITMRLDQAAMTVIGQSIVVGSELEAQIEAISIPDDGVTNYTNAISVSGSSATTLIMGPQ
jgi:hypothetical protein